MNEKQINQWRKTRKMEKKKFVFFYGLLCFGLITGLIGSFFGAFLFRKPLSLERFIVSIVVCSILGIAINISTWNSSEKKYQEKMKIKD